MKVAVAQIDMRLGDIEAICARVEGQAAIAREQGARLLCVPAPLVSGTLPGMLIDSQNFIHDVLSALQALAARLEALGIVTLIPAVVAQGDTPVFEAFMLKEGRVVPVRTLTALRLEHMGEDPWLPPVFEVDGLRCAITFDFNRDIELVPAGCDALVYFQTGCFSVARAESTAVAAVADGYFRPGIVRRSMYLVCVAPVGGFDDTVYTGGSFVMDDCGRTVAAAPCFEEALLVQDVQRGITLPAIEDHMLPHFDRSEWLWEALRLWLADAAASRGRSRAVVVLSGDLPSSLAAALCVDAFGPRNVLGIVVARSRTFTPEMEARERERVELVRSLATNLHIRLVERTEPDLTELLDRDVPVAALGADGAGTLGTDAVQRARSAFESLLLSDLAADARALPVRSLCKTEYAMAADSVSAGCAGAVAPFGDVYLTALEFLARWRNRSGAALPAQLVSLRAVKAYQADIVAHAAAFANIDAAFSERAVALLGALEPSELDGVLEAHVDRALSFEDIPLAKTRPDTVALALLLVRQGEAARRSLPAYPVVSGCSFVERAWPAALAWSDFGRQGAEPLTLEALLKAEVERSESRGAEMGERMRNEVLGFISNLLGISSEELEELGSEEGRARLGANLPQVEEQIQRSLQQLFEQGGAPGAGGDPRGPHGFSFFSQN